MSRPDRCAKRYELPAAWNAAVDARCDWLRLAGPSPATVRLRRGRHLTDNQDATLK